MITPEETEPPHILRQLRRSLERPAGQDLTDPRFLFERVLTDPGFAGIHRAMLLATGTTVPADPRQVRRLEKRVREGSFHLTTAIDRKAVLADASALESLQVSHWVARGA